MNERIQELYNKAWSKVDPTNPKETFTKAFAELIIQDCLELCLTKVGNGDYNRGRMDCHDNIKEHFGIEK